MRENDIPAGEHVLATRIPEYHRIEGLDPQKPTDPAGRMDALIERARAFDDRPHARIVAMLEGLLTEDQWRELEAAAERRAQR